MLRQMKLVRHFSHKPLLILTHNGGQRDPREFKDQYDIAQKERSVWVRRICAPSRVTMGQYGSASFDQNWVTVLISFEEDDDGLVVSKTEYKSLKTCTYLF